MADTAQVVKLKVTGMHCSSCSTAVQKALSLTTGVEKASVSLTLEQAEVVYDPTIVKEVTMQALQRPLMLCLQYAPSSVHFQLKQSSHSTLPQVWPSRPVWPGT